MRRNRIALALLLLMVAGTIIAWLAFDDDTPAPVDVSDETLDDGSRRVSPLDDESRVPDGRPGKGIPVNSDPAPSRAFEDNSTSEPDENDWRLKGRIVFDDDVPAILRNTWTEDTGVQIVYLQDGAKPQNARTIFTFVDKDLRFESTRTPKTFGHEPGDFPKPGRWQVLFELQEEYPRTLWNLDEVEESALRGLVRPQITGRTIDFGDVHVGIDAYMSEDCLVMGRLVHTSGRPLAYAGMGQLWGIDEHEDEEREITAELRTDKDGNFCALASFYPYDAELRHQKMKFKLVPSEGDFNNEENVAELPSPSRSGRILDFGEVKLEGALIEFILKGPMKAVTSAADQPAFDRWGEYHGDCVDVSLESNNGYVQARVMPQPFTTSIVVPEGRYVWNASAEGEGFYPLGHGVLLTRNGAVHRLELDFTPFPSIPLEITADEGKPKNVVVYWDILQDEEYLAGGSYHVSEAPRVPVQTGCTTGVIVEAPGYYDGEAQAEPGMDKLVVSLIRDVRPRAKLVVLVPAFPEGLDKSYSGRCDLSIENDEENSSCEVEWNDMQTECSLEVLQGGRYTLCLDGGEPYGYPGGLFFGPVEIELTLGEETRYEIPAIPLPPWSAPISRMRVAARAGGEPVDLNGWVVYEGRNQPIFEELDDGREIRVRGLPLALKDDFDTYPVEFNQPIEGSMAELKIDFPHTIEVRATRNGKVMPHFRVTAGSEGEVTHSLQCTADAVSGLAKLWFPRGAVRIEVEALGRRLYSNKHEVTPGAVLSVDVTIALVELTVDCAGAYNPMHGEELPDMWRLEEPDGDKWRECGGVSKSTVLALDPGEYRFVPWNGGAHEAVEVDLRDGEDRSIRLSDVGAPQAASTILKFDVKLLGEGWSDCEIVYQLTRRLEANGDHEGEARSCYSSIVPDGVKLAGVPLNVEIAIWGGLWYETPDDEQYLLLKPLRVTVSEDGMLVDATFSRTVDIAQEWYQVRSRLATGIAGLNIRLDGYAPAGRHEYEFYDRQGKLLLKDWITLPENPEKPVTLPPAIRARLEALGALKPAEGD